MFIAVALETIGDSIIYIETGFGMLRPRFDVMNLQYAATFSAFLACIVIALNYGQAPFFVFNATVGDVSLSCASSFSALVVWLRVAFLHGTFVHGFPALRREHFFSRFGNFCSSVRARVCAINRAILGNCPFRLKDFPTIGTRFDHDIFSKKIPCLCRWLLLSRQLAPIHKQGILNNYTPATTMLKAT